MPDSPDRKQEIFERALECATPAARASYLDAACNGDAELRRDIEALLKAHEGAGDFMVMSAAAAAGVDRPASASAGLATIEPAPGERIGRYKLLEKIGEGGWGIVYLAEQEEPIRRNVALKVIKLGMDTSAVIARFEAERQALAMMEHPNIARVFDGGATASGRPFFVMELVRGVAITTFCDEQRLGTNERLQLFSDVCHAVQHAHQKGIIHRDLKPSNILVTLHDGRAVPKVIDFGIAKATEQPLTEKTFFTHFQQFIGTPAYMSPEQTGLSGLDVDTRSDVYSLGVLLYELLTGRTPFDARALLAIGYEEIQRAIRERDPPRPSTRVGLLSAEERTTAAECRRLASTELISELRGDLDWIAMKCLQKERSRRYDTANDLAMDLARHLAHHPVLARPDSPAYRAAKFFRRHRVPVSFALVLLIALVAGLVGTLTQARRATRQAAIADTQRRRADEQRDFALRQLSRAEAINSLNSFLLSDAAPQGGTLSVGQLLAEAEDIAKRPGADTDANRAEILIAVGSQYLAREMDVQAREVLEQAYALSEKIRDHALHAKAAATLAGALGRSGDFAHAKTLVHDALAELDADANPHSDLDRVYCLLRASWVDRESGDPADGVARAEEAQEIVQRSPLASALSKLTVAIELAQSYTDAGAFARSRRGLRSCPHANCRARS